MTRRSSRFDMPPDLSKVMEALRDCRQSMIGVLSKVRIGGPVYHGASMVVAAIDAMATLLTRNPEYFWARGSVMTEQQRQAMVERNVIAERISVEGQLDAARSGTATFESGTVKVSDDI